MHGSETKRCPNCCEPVISGGGLKGFLLGILGHLRVCPAFTDEERRATIETYLAMLEVLSGRRT